MCWIGLAAGSVSCGVPDDPAAPAVQVEFDVALQAPTRAPEALAGNEGKIVYGYSLGTTDYKGAQSTDPSGIDAEASIRNGAHIVYSDTNNSSNDFHQRAKASLKQ